MTGQSRLPQAIGSTSGADDNARMVFEQNVIPAYWVPFFTALAQRADLSAATSGSLSRDYRRGRSSCPSPSVTRDPAAVCDSLADILCGGVAPAASASSAPPGFSVQSVLATVALEHTKLGVPGAPPPVDVEATDER